MDRDDKLYKEFKDIYGRATKLNGAGICNFDFKENGLHYVGFFNYRNRFGQMFITNQTTGRAREWMVDKGYSSNYKES